MSLKNIFRQGISLFSKALKIKDIILLESISDFSDNTYALFQKMIDLNINNKYKIIWLVKNENGADNITDIPNVEIFNVTKGNKLVREIKLFRLYASARYVFFSHSLYSKTLPKKGQDVVFLTHGVHFKNGEGRYFDMNKITHLITVSENDNQIAEKVYSVNKDKLRILGYPRNDYLLTADTTIQQKVYKYLNVESEKLIFWMPTFRRHMNKLTNDSKLSDIQSDLPLLKTGEDFQLLNKYLKLNEQVLVIKPHPSQDMSVFKTVELSNIKVLTNQDLMKLNVQLYQALNLADVLITDYSSVFIDFLLTDKPIVFTTDDIESYDHNLGFMLEDYLKYMPGEKVHELDQFISLIMDGFVESEAQVANRLAVKKYFHLYEDASSSQRLINYFF